MRFRFGSSVLYPLLLSATLAVGLLISGGCGSGGNGGSQPFATPTPAPSTTPTATPTPLAPVSVQTQIIWAARSRATGTPQNNVVSGPSSALSAVITLAGANASTGGNLSYSVDRDTTKTSGYTQTYSSGSLQAHPGTYLLTVDFYAKAGAQGDKVGTAQANATVLSTGALTMTIATNTRISSVVVLGVSYNGGAPVSRLPLNQQGDVLYTAFDGPNGTGNVVAVTPGSGFANSSDTSKVSVQGDRVTAIAPTGLTNITVTVDGVTSAAFPVSILSGATLSVFPTSATNVSPGASVFFTATVTNDPNNSGVTWSLDEGATAGTLSGITTTSVIYTAPTLIGGATYHLRATSNYDPALTFVVPISVSSHVTVAISPNPAPTVSISGTQKFTATVGNVPSGQDNGVTWTVQEGAAGGSITGGGVYTAPATPGTYHVVATSRYDTSVSDTVAITVASGNLPVVVK